MRRTIFRKTSFITSIVIFLSVSFGGYVFAEENEQQQLGDKDYAWGWLISAERDEVYYPDRVIELLGLSPGDSVADIDPGPGYFTFRLAKAVGPSGRVYAVTVDERPAPQLAVYMAEQVLDVKANRYGNVTLMRSPGNIGLPAESIDAAFLSLVFLVMDEPGTIPPDRHSWPEETLRDKYEFSQKVVKTIYDALKPGGRMVVIDGIDSPVLYSGGLSREQVRKILGILPPTREGLDGLVKKYEGFGFRFLEAHDIYSNEKYKQDVESFKGLPVFESISEMEIPLFISERFFLVFEKPGQGSEAVPAEDLRSVTAVPAEDLRSVTPMGGRTRRRGKR